MIKILPILFLSFSYLTLTYFLSNFALLQRPITRQTKLACLLSCQKLFKKLNIFTNSFIFLILIIQNVNGFIFYLDKVLYLFLNSWQRWCRKKRCDGRIDCIWETEHDEKNCDDCPPDKPNRCACNKRGNLTCDDYGWICYSNSCK